MNIKNITLVLAVTAIVIIGAVLRLYNLGEIPPGLNIDESSMGYNAFSLSETGRDRYGKEFPILFRSFGSFQPPLYTYLTVIPVSLVGPSIFSVRVVSAIFGVIAILATFLIVLIFTGRKSVFSALLAATVIAIAPWSVFFSRIATEANLGFGLFALAVLLFVLSLNKPWLFVLGCFILGMTTHAYYSERLTAIIFLAVFTFVFRKSLLKERKWVVVGLGLFILTQIPHLIIAGSGALTRRVEQVYYWNNSFFQQNGGDLRNIPFGNGIYYLREFLSQYMAYLSPKNLFFDPDPQGARSIPDLSVFYSWMVIPFAFGMNFLVKNLRLPLVKLILILLVIGPIPAALTRDPFYTLRTLIYLWAVTIVIALGSGEVLRMVSSGIKNRSLSLALKSVILAALILFSLSSFYLSYFVMGKYERGESYGYSYIKLMDKIKEFGSDRFVIDSSRDLAIGVRYAFLTRYDPRILQQELGPKALDRYYSSVEFDEPYMLGNIEVRPIVWAEDIYKDYILVGDNLAISDSQIREHKLQFLFGVTDLAGKITLKAYRTNPQEKCYVSQTQTGSKCAKWQ